MYQLFFYLMIFFKVGIPLVCFECEWFGAWVFKSFLFLIVTEVEVMVVGTSGDT